MREIFSLWIFLIYFSIFWFVSLYNPHSNIHYIDGCSFSIFIHICCWKLWVGNNKIEKQPKKRIHNMCVILFVSNNQSFVGKNQKEKQIIYYISHPHIHWLNEKQYRFDDEKIETHLIHFISFKSFLYYKTYHLIIGLQISAIDCDFLPKNVALYIFVVLVVFLWF